MKLCDRFFDKFSDTNNRIQTNLNLYGILKAFFEGILKAWTVALPWSRGKGDS